MRIKALEVIPFAHATFVFLTSPFELHLLVEATRYHQVRWLCNTTKPNKLGPTHLIT